MGLKIRANYGIAKRAIIAGPTRPGMSQWRVKHVCADLGDLLVALGPGWGHRGGVIEKRIGGKFLSIIARPMVAIGRKGDQVGAHPAFADDAVAVAAHV